MEGIYVAVHRFPRMGVALLTDQGRAYCLKNSKTAIAQEVLNHPNVASVDFDGIKVRSVTGILSLTLRETCHTFALIADACADNEPLRTSVSLPDGTRYASVNTSSPKRHAVRELSITYEVSVV